MHPKLDLMVLKTTAWSLWEITQKQGETWETFALETPLNLWPSCLRALPKPSPPCF